MVEIRIGVYRLFSDAYCCYREVDSIFQGTIQFRLRRDRLFRRSGHGPRAFIALLPAARTSGSPCTRSGTTQSCNTRSSKDW